MYPPTTQPTRGSQIEPSRRRALADHRRHQNNFASAATHVRVVLHLSDVRILAIGVLHDQPSLFVNPNAHLLLHPPLLRRLSRPPTRSVPQVTDLRYSGTSTAPIAIASRGPAAATAPSHNPNEIYYPLARSMSPSGPLSTSYGLGEGSPATSPAERSSHPPQSQSSRRTTLSSLLPSLGRRTSATADAGDDAMIGTSGTSGTSPVGRFGAMLTQVRSRDSDDGGQSRSRRWSLGRTRTSSATAVPSYVGEGTSAGQGRVNPVAPPEVSTPSMPTLPELPLSPDQSHRAAQPLLPESHRPPTPPKTPTPPPRVPAYSILRKPQPALSHARYPNYTESQAGEDDLPSKSDLRGSHIEVEDDGLGAIWSSGEAKWGDDGMRMAEWDPAEERIKRWVGPMMWVRRDASSSCLFFMSLLHASWYRLPSKTRLSPSPRGDSADHSQVARTADPADSSRNCTHVIAPTRIHQDQAPTVR